MSGPRFGKLPAAGGWVTIPVGLPPETIQQVCVLFEGYDNLAIVRTPVAGEGRVYVYTWEGNAETAERILGEIGKELPIRIGARVPGMLDIEKAWD